MEKPASLILTCRNGKVVKSQWKYRYSDGSDTALAASTELYEQLAGVADSRMEAEGKGMCTHPGNMTVNYGDKLEIVRDMDGDKPYVSVTVLSGFSEIFG